jgi:maltose/moltooligosaccharide transporter
LWLAAPITGLVVQPIIGYLSDRTWHPRLGRRRPYFLIGAILASITLIFVPYSPVLWVAAGCLWILDSSINISMEPFRALVADKLPDDQRSNGFMVQTLIIGIGTWIASQLPWFLNKLGVSNEAGMGEIPVNVKYAFAIGAFVFIGSILYTVFTTSEYSPEEMKKFREQGNEANDVRFQGVRFIPKTMLKLGVIQFFSWFAFFTMWSMATPALTEHVFSAPKPNTEVVSMTTDVYKAADAKYNDAADLVGSAMGSYGLSSMVFAFILTLITRKRRINRKFVHMTSLILGGLGFILMYYAHDSAMLNLCFVLIGISWGSILSMPYAMLSSAIDPDKMGLFMGLFNMFIVIPQIVASLGGINLFSKLIFGEATINTMLLAGSSLILAGLCNFLITNPKAITYTED